MRETNKENEWFAEWEQRAFGAGYGTGETPILEAIKKFFSLLKDQRTYNFQELEAGLGETVTWFLINALARMDNIEWGTSSRFGWLTPSGEVLRRFMENKTVEELYSILDRDESESVCLCNGEEKSSGHEDCGKNPMIDEKIAYKYLYN